MFDEDDDRPASRCEFAISPQMIKEGLRWLAYKDDWRLTDEEVVANLFAAMLACYRHESMGTSE